LFKIFKELPHEIGKEICEMFDMPEEFVEEDEMSNIQP